MLQKATEEPSSASVVPEAPKDIETPSELASEVAKAPVGKKIKMLLELKNDTLNMTFPVDDNWQKDKNFYWIVKYVKLE